jgi:hypothetical protein
MALFVLMAVPTLAVSAVLIVVLALPTTLVLICIKMADHHLQEGIQNFFTWIRRTGLSLTNRRMPSKNDNQD